MDPKAHQPQLDLDHAPALEQAMRDVFETRWRRWHPKTFEEAVQDPITRRLLCLQVEHLRCMQPTPRRRRPPRPPERP